MNEGNCNKNLQMLIEIREQCIDLEYENLKYYCECMLKMFRTFYKIEQTEMLSYIKRIMSPAFPLMVRYFGNRAEAYMLSKTEMERVEIFEDIERSVTGFWDVHEAIIQSSNGADRILMQTAPIDSGVHYAVPKLCAYYSELLNSLANILDEDEEKTESHYAFCVYPTLNSQAEAELLFTTMEQRGKVGIIRVPGKDIADVEYITTLLLHEFFHIIPGELRLRKYRAHLFLKILFFDFESIVMGKLEVTEKKDKEKLRKFLFGKLANKITEEMRSHKSEDRFFYSRDIKEYYTNAFIKQLKDISESSFLDMVECLYPRCPFESVTEYLKKRDPVKKWHLQIRTNIWGVCTSSVIIKRCSFYMGVFREAYADLLSVISLNLSPGRYFSVFRYTQSDVDENFRRIGLFLRVFFVKEVMSEKIEKVIPDWKIPLFQCWGEWKKNINEQRSQSGLINGIDRITEIFRRKSDSFSECEDKRKDLSDLEAWEEGMVPNKVILESYLSYFRECRDKYLEHLSSQKERFKEFEQQFLIDRGESLIYSISFRQWERV